MQALTWLYAAPLTLGVLLVLCSTLGAVELDTGGGITDIADDEGFLAWLGLGRIPALIVATFLLLIFGSVGLLTCRPLTAALGVQAGFFASLPLASLCAFYGTSYGSRWLARVLPRTETYAPTSRDLVGRIGRVVVRLDADSCIVRVSDAAGAEHRLRCRVASAAVGDNVLVTGFETREYIARKLS